MNKYVFKGNHASVAAGGGAFIILSSDGQSLVLEPPVFNLSTGQLSKYAFCGVSDEKTLRNGGRQVTLRYKADGGISLYTDVRLFINTGAVRFRYRLFSDSPASMEKPAGTDALEYFSLDIGRAASVTELQFSQFIPHIHSFAPTLNDLTQTELTHGAELAGPVVLWDTAEMSALIGYEHGADHPDTYFKYRVSACDGCARLALSAKKGNYYSGQALTSDGGFTSAWFHIMLGKPGRDALTTQYRRFFERDICENSESRKPYIFYNTWNYQERDRNFNGMPYLTNMKEARVLEEIEAAHRMGIEVFVIDTGWFNKTGDWSVNTGFFPSGMTAVKKRLDEYGMKLGLWFNPIVAARTSRLALDYPDERMSIDGRHKYGQIWETEESCGMCLCSDYAERFADKLIELNEQLGVRYFKWDGVDQYGCDSPLHGHGTELNSPKERAECYSYQMGLRMIEIVEKLTERCPEAIVDFDITESGRFVGLGFLSAGKYFLINNGPYAKDFDLPEHFRYNGEISLSPYTNIFFFPGAARPRFCRQGIEYDSFVPSTLFLTHYLPDGGGNAMSNSMASMVLGGNGIWGSLKDLSGHEIEYWSVQISEYKKVREHAASVPARRRGRIGGSPEIYEKLSDGRGIVVFFTHFQGSYSHIIGPFAQAPVITGADKLEVLADGCVRVAVELPKDGARVVYVYGR